MKRNIFAAGLCAAACGLALASLAVADPVDDAKKSGAPEIQLPPGWTAEDMQAVVAAGTPGKMHEQLAKDAGQWHGKTTMWMSPGAQPMKGECKATVTPVMDGRFTKWEIEGEMPGMGPYHGLGFYGYDNVSQQFASTWIDNHGTGIMSGVGELSNDGKTITWTYTVNCPITKKPTTIREVDVLTGPDSRRLEMFGVEPKSGKEFKSMTIEFTRK
jgi:hypothetical protein